MARIIATGIEVFQKLRQKNLFYIDKTKFIKDWWIGEDSVTLITRPRRFGKTLMLDTVRTFFSPEFAGQSQLFNDLDVWKDEELRKVQGKIPVIFLSFSDVKEKNYEDAIASIKYILSSTYRYIERQLDSSSFSNWERQLFSSMNLEMTDLAAKKSLRYLSECLTYQYNIKPIILLDEYDTPLQEAWLNGYWDKLAAFMRVLFNATFKSNPFLERGLITGITRIDKESIFSDLNNLEVVSTTSDLYTDCFGFTEEEVFAAMDEYGLTNKDEVKYWYDGFIFGNHKGIYNPWSIIGYLSKKRFNTYWGNTSSNALVEKLITEATVDIKDDFVQLLQGQAIIVNFDEDIIFSQLNQERGAIWSLLMASGYIKPLEYNFITNEFKVLFTNFEVNILINKMIYKWFNKGTTKNITFCQTLLKNDLEKMNEKLNNITNNVFSFFDTGGNEPERFYHGFVLGLIVDLKDIYTIKANRESGKGRYDVTMFPKNANDPGIVIEFKTLDLEVEGKLEKTCNNALKQIRENEYITELLDNNIDINNIYVYGFGFKGKNVLIYGGAYTQLDWSKILMGKNEVEEIERKEIN